MAQVNSAVSNAAGIQECKIILDVGLFKIITLFTRMYKK